MRRITIGFVFCIVAVMMIFSSAVSAESSHKSKLYSGSVQTFISELNSRSLASDGRGIRATKQAQEEPGAPPVFACEYESDTSRVIILIPEKEGDGIDLIINLYPDTDDGLKSFSHIWKHESELLGLSTDDQNLVLNTSDKANIMDMNNEGMIVATKEIRRGIVVLRLMKLHIPK